MTKYAYDLHTCMKHFYIYVMHVVFFAHSVKDHKPFIKEFSVFMNSVIFTEIIILQNTIGTTYIDFPVLT